MKKILYFTNDFSQENQDFAKEHGLLIRNAQAYETVDYLEKCDMVCGDVPFAYQNAYPVFELPTKQDGIGEQESFSLSDIDDDNQDDTQDESLHEVVEVPVADEVSNETANTPSVDEVTKDELKPAEPADKAATKPAKPKTTKKSA